MTCALHHKPEPCPECESRESADSTFVREQTLDVDAPEVDGLDWGTKVDRYVVHDLIGRGGMGLVYTALDPDLGRWVAIKLLRSAAAPGSAASLGQARLLREAQAMAQLSHPNVMPVYDVGKYGKSVFVAMELVRGPTLDKWVKASPRGWREIRDVFLQAGRGLEAAHAAGLVHRDFKPANVLMGEDGRPRVTDFGIARSLRSPEPQAEASEPAIPEHSTPTSLEVPLTRAGVMMGSPGYMAPEQYAGLPTSPATNQFAFCVALHEALYGARPFIGKTLAELSHLTTLGKVPAPPKGGPVPLWLHRVVEKGLSPDAANRHASMGALLEALARDPEQELRVKLAVGAVVVTVLALAGAVTFTQVQQQRACRDTEQMLTGVWDEAARKAGKAAFAATGKSYAPLAWEHVRAEMDTYAGAWLRARTEACAATRRRNEQPEAVMLARFDCLEQRRRELHALAKAYAVADVETVDRAYEATARLSALETCAHARIDLKVAPPEARGAVEQMGRDLADGRALSFAGKLDPAREQLTSALQISRALALPAQQAEIELAVAELEITARNHRAGSEAYQRSARLAETVGNDEGAARALTALVSVIGWRLERPDEGRTLAGIAAGKLARIGGDARIGATLSEALGDLEWQAGNRELSIGHYREALQAFIALGGEQSIDAARLHSSLGWVLTEQGQLSEARTELEKSRKTREAVLGEDHPVLSEMWNELGALAVSMGDDGEAIRCHEQQVRISRLARGPDTIGTARAELNLIEVLVRDGRAAESDRLLKHARAVITGTADRPASHVVQVIRAQALVYTSLGRLADAERAAREAVVECERVFGREHPETALVVLALARVFEAQKKWPLALEQLDRYLAIEKKVGATSDPEYALALGESGVALHQVKRRPEALQRLEQALALLPLEKGNLRRAGWVRLWLADSLIEAPATRARAKQLAAEAKSCFETAHHVDGVKRVEVWLATNRGGG